VYHTILFLFTLKFLVVYKHIVYNACYFKQIFNLLSMSNFFRRHQIFYVVKGIYLFYNFVIYYNICSIWLSSFKCHQIAFSMDTVQPCSVTTGFKLRAAFHQISSLLDTTTWSSANNRVNSSSCFLKWNSFYVFSLPYL